jgi:hypothetical protein
MSNAAAGSAKYCNNHTQQMTGCSGHYARRFMQEGGNDGGCSNQRISRDDDDDDEKFACNLKQAAKVQRSKLATKQKCGEMRLNKKAAARCL